MKVSGKKSEERNKKDLKYKKRRIEKEKLSLGGKRGGEGEEVGRKKRTDLFT
jgi:hypothetical protein